MRLEATSSQPQIKKMYDNAASRLFSVPLSLCTYLCFCLSLGHPTYLFVSLRFFLSTSACLSPHPLPPHRLSLSLTPPRSHPSLTPSPPAALPPPPDPLAPTTQAPAKTGTWLTPGLYPMLPRPRIFPLPSRFVPPRQGQVSVVLSGAAVAWCRLPKPRGVLWR